MEVFSHSAKSHTERQRDSQRLERKTVGGKGGTGRVSAAGGWQGGREREESKLAGAPEAEGASRCARHTTATEEEPSREPLLGRLGQQSRSGVEATGRQPQTVDRPLGAGSMFLAPQKWDV